MVEEGSRLKIVAEMHVLPGQEIEFSELLRFTLMAGGMSREEMDQSDLTVHISRPEEELLDSLDHSLKIR